MSLLIYNSLDHAVIVVSALDFREYTAFPGVSTTVPYGDILIDDLLVRPNLRKLAIVGGSGPNYASVFRHSANAFVQSADSVNLETREITYNRNPGPPLSMSTYTLVVVILILAAAIVAIVIINLTRPAD